MATLNRFLLFLYDFVRVALRDSQFLDRLPLDVPPHSISDLLPVLLGLVKDVLAVLQVQVELPSQDYVLLLPVFLDLLEERSLSPV